MNSAAPSHPSAAPGTIMHVVGARPNFVKAAPVVHALQERGVAPVIVHTGQHYDALLSDAFFVDLELPAPVENLGVGSGSHAHQTAALLLGLDGALDRCDPAIVVVYGDVNSTMAAALVAAKRQIPVVHVEAGLRSFDTSMPEEINRRVTDQLASLLLTTSTDAGENLRREGRSADSIRFVGNTMIDSLDRARARLDPHGAARDLGVGGNDWVLATLHRPSNVDESTRSRALLAALEIIARQCPVVFPVHPRTRARWADDGVTPGAGIVVVDPLPYGRFLSVLAGSRLVITDSGGVQEESTVLGVPCLTVRATTERPVTIERGTNQLVAVENLVSVATAIVERAAPRDGQRPPLWDGHAGERAAEAILEFVRTQQREH
jgi:UDP-N-acetylglucosamine 2-epimerase (non-hydrolysing)